MSAVLGKRSHAWLARMPQVKLNSAPAEEARFTREGGTGLSLFGRALPLFTPRFMLSNCSKFDYVYGP